ncbi:MAG: TlpA family protein disulfide reductase [Clostridiales bacterium]|nr:TlpA family protein disulfide reductase [Clostridiales bacterium]
MTPLALLPPLFPLPDFVTLYRSLGVQTFALTLLAGLLLAYLTLPLFLRDLSSEERRAWEEASFWMALFAFLGARLLEQVVQPDMALLRPLTWFRFGGYSLSFAGALLGALAVALWKRLSLRLLDRLMPALGLALAVGALGLPGVGKPTSLPWAMALKGGTGAALIGSQGLHPIQLYFFLGYLLLGLGAAYLLRRPHRPGEVTLTFFLLLFPLRFVLGFFVFTPPVLGGLTWTQWGDLMGFAVAFAVFLWERKPLSRFALGSLGLLLLVGAFLFFSADPAKETVSLPLPGFPAPAFTLPDLEGKPQDLQSWRGEPVILNFWATWCPPCQWEMPAIDAFHKETGARVVGIDMQEHPLKVRDYIQARGFTYPILLDEKGDVSRLYWVRNIPTTFVVDGQGIIRYVHQGPITYPELMKYWEAVGGR